MYERDRNVFVMYTCIIIVIHTQENFHPLTYTAAHYCCVVDELIGIILIM